MLGRSGIRFMTWNTATDDEDGKTKATLTVNTKDNCVYVCR